MKRHDYDVSSQEGECTIMVGCPYPSEYHTEVCVYAPKREKFCLGLVTHSAFGEPCWLTREECQQVIDLLQEYMEKQNGNA